jgi:hypothetical protein
MAATVIEGRFSVELKGERRGRCTAARQAVGQHLVLIPHPPNDFADLLIESLFSKRFEISHRFCRIATGHVQRDFSIAAFCTTITAEWISARLT